MPCFRTCRLGAPLFATVALFGATGVIVALGCGESPPPPVVAAPPTPKEQLLVVIERLDEALDSAHTPPGSGVVSERKCMFELLPEEAGQPPRARVTITRSVALAGGNGALVKEGQLPATPPEIEEKEDFILDYKGGVWRLRDKPESELLAICWEYALNQK